MRTFPAALMVILVSAPALAGEISSEYTDLDTVKDCVTYATAAEGDGEWANLACAGYRGFPVLLSYNDARESLFYGFPPAGDVAPAWESFSAFNSSGPKIEWRVEAFGDRKVPFATIHRRNVSSPEDSDTKIEVLVVSKVAQMVERESCVIGLVVATGNSSANEMARKIADEQTLTFVCGADQRTVVSGDIELPEFSRTEN
ncbi:hypothetical protein GA830_03205 [Mesorhizobium sp. NBSH29]|uniref:hypothetical protein n=1 Tax=Mesorhizobium sp. NBSH29 TaxID=2654249 RepID=UPI001896807A|nr:hypothetical protein [Mesorhizobium sp. NBSH29]QPC85848.1 hypothetical protein GA830_03205 [Mesorhizobium sp. NBSH29]